MTAKAPVLTLCRYLSLDYLSYPPSTWIRISSLDSMQLLKLNFPHINLRYPYKNEQVT